MYDHDKRRALLNRIVEYPAIRPACRHCQIDYSTFWLWIERSSPPINDPKLTLDWPIGSPQQPFAELYKKARKMSIALWESQCRQEVMTDGGCVSTRQVVHDGKLIMKEKDQFFGWSDDEMLALGFDLSERWERDELGRLVPLTVTDISPAPAHLKIALLRGLCGDTYADKRQVDSRHVVTGGVMIVPTPLESRAVIDVEATPALRSPEPQDGPEMDAEPDLPEWTPASVAPPPAPPQRSLDHLGAGTVAPRGFKVA